LLRSGRPVEVELCEQDWRVSGFVPPGDIHRVRNAGDGAAISIRVYRTDVSRIGTSARRYYDPPVVPARSAA
jgi:oxalate decarboxylase/phosphoglucose isomerase-like protein (cupin superfamily)